jgi:hypothetical protein
MVSPDVEILDVEEKESSWITRVHVAETRASRGATPHDHLVHLHSIAMSSRPTIL